jgi:hypothetical protein
MSGVLWNRGGIRRLAHIIAMAAGLALTALPTAPRAAAQNLEDYDYENLGFRALGVDILYASAKDAEGTIGFGVRADLGFLGPYLRVVPRFAYWSANVDDGAVDRFEQNLEDLCSPPGCDINLGRLTRDYWVLAFDIQWTLPERTVAPYVGVGVDAYILDDSGDAIQGTFLDDAIVTAGLSAVGGLQLDLGRHLRLYSDVRGTLVTSASNWALYGGVAYRF